MRKSARLKNNAGTRAGRTRLDRFSRGSRQRRAPAGCFRSDPPPFYCGAGEASLRNRKFGHRVHRTDQRTTTLSNVAVASCVVSWLETARPTYTFAAIVNVSLPTAVHVVPSPETYAVMTFPRRSSLTHAGAPPAPPLVLTDVPPRLSLRWNAS